MKSKLVTVIVGMLLITNPTLTQINTSHAPFLSTSAESFSEIWGCSDPEHPHHRREAIPSVDDPQFYSVSQADRDIPDDDLVLVATVNGEHRIYPYNILREHEVVNDFNLGLNNYGITYCPITGSGLSFDLDQIGNSEIGVTGVLLESNLVFYDRDSDSCFSQMLAFGMSGERIQQRLAYEPVIETTWESAKRLFPEAEVMNRDIRSYEPERYDPNRYENYETSDSLLFPVNYLEDEPYNFYHVKEPTLVIRDLNETYLFPYQELFKEKVTNHEIDSGNITIFADETNRLVIPYFKHGDLTGTNFSLVTDQEVYDQYQNYASILAQNEDGQIWNILGQEVSIPDGNDLTQFPAYSAYWYAAIVFFTNGVIYQTNTTVQFDIEPQLDNVFNPETNLDQFVIIIGLFGVLFVLVILYAKRKSE